MTVTTPDKIEAVYVTKSVVPVACTVPKAVCETFVPSVVTVNTSLCVLSLPSVATTKYFTDVTVSELISEFKSGNLREIFGCGTAAVIAPISSFGYKDERFEIREVENSYADSLKTSIVNIQQNLSEDSHGWRYKILD